MAESANSLPEIDGGITKEIREGKLSRRNFLVATGFVGVGVFSARSLGTLTNKTPIMGDSKGVLFHETERCVACRRCELACTAFNDGLSGGSSAARVKIGRNLNLGPRGANATGFYWGEGDFGNGKIVAETCKQCPHPVPCAEACPKGAIKADATTGARKIDTSLCVGCGICTVACPWGMPTLRADGKSSKCFLCDGNPECAHACPTGALTYVAWRDLRMQTPVVQSGIMPAGTTTNCSTCHN
jgi:Fe-S-cluster-containing dehydrogenase component